MAQTEQACASFIVRVRREPGDGWRGAIEDVSSGARRSFSGLEGVVPVMKSLVAEADAGPGPCPEAPPRAADGDADRLARSGANSDAGRVH
jgi:hypothetical protein